MISKRLSKLKISGFKMFRIKMPPLTIGDSVARVPIVQGGMGVGISLSGLASAVAMAVLRGDAQPPDGACRRSPHPC